MQYNSHRRTAEQHTARRIVGNEEFTEYFRHHNIPHSGRGSTTICETVNAARLYSRRQHIWLNDAIGERLRAGTQYMPIGTLIDRRQAHDTLSNDIIFAPKPESLPFPKTSMLEQRVPANRVYGMTIKRKMGTNGDSVAEEGLKENLQKKLLLGEALSSQGI